MACVRSGPLPADLEDIARAVIEDMYSELLEFEEAQEAALIHDYCEEEGDRDRPPGDDAPVVLCPLCKIRYLAEAHGAATCKCGFRVSVPVREGDAGASRVCAFRPLSDSVELCVQPADGLALLQQRLAAVYEEHSQGCGHDPGFACLDGGLLMVCAACDATVAVV